MKRMIALLLLCILCVPTLAVAAVPQTEDDFVYEVLGEGTGVSLQEYVGNETRVIVPDTLGGKPVKTVGAGAFMKNYNLLEVVLPASVAEIGNMAFAQCSNLQKITVRGTLTRIGKGAFSTCYKLDNVTISAKELVLEEGAFETCEYLEHLDIQGSVESIGKRAFSTTALREISFLKDVKTIEDSAFFKCSLLTEVHLPAGLLSLGIRVFEGCDRLERITVDPANAQYTAQDNVIFTKDVKTLLACAPLVRSGVYTVPSSVTAIADSAFRGNKSLQTVHFPSGLQSIGYGAFEGCRRLQTLVLPDSVTEIDSAAFRNCSSLVYAHLPAGLKVLSKETFMGNTSLTKVDLPDGLEEIWHRAMLDCPALRVLTVPESVIWIEPKSLGCVKKSATEIVCTGELVICGVPRSEAEEYAKAHKLVFREPSPALLGDVDGDAAITSTDARLVLQYYAGKLGEGAVDPALSDVDGDGNITSTDARLILQYYAGKIDKFPVQ